MLYKDNPIYSVINEFQRKGLILQDSLYKQYRNVHNIGLCVFKGYLLNESLWIQEKEHMDIIGRDLVPGIVSMYQTRNTHNYESKHE